MTTLITYMNKELIFLEKSQAQRLRKDMCVFSGKQFNTKHIHSEVSKQWFGSEYYEHQEDVTYDSHIIKELDMYVFTFNFTKDAQKALTDKKREFEQNAATYRKEQIEKCREELLSLIHI